LRSKWVEISVIAALVLASFYAGIFNLDINDVVNFSVTRVTFPGGLFVSTILASLATIVAIYFSIVILAVQHAAGNYTASILEDYKRDRSSWITYAFLLAGLSLSAFILRNESSTLILPSGKTISLLNFSLVMFIFSFLILTLQFMHTFDLVSPTKIITKAKINCLEKINTLKNLGVVKQFSENPLIFSVID
jgi:uncharacterized membrane protein